ncbi:MAG: hypothetical protein WBA35_05755, partial [Litorimonas sp.]
MTRSVRVTVIGLVAIFALGGCDVSISVGGIEDMDAPIVVEDLEPLPPEHLSYAQDIVRLLYAERTEELVA